MRVAFQGIRGAYSEMALKRHFKSEAQPVSCASFEEVFKAVMEAGVEFGFVPAENTIAGTVVENYDLLLSHDVVVRAEVYMAIAHMLLAKKGTLFVDISRVLSHPHALNQCKAFLRQHGLKAVPAYDTAGAAKEVAKRSSKRWAAISSILCAEIYGLDILKKNIQSTQTNTTRFLVIAKNQKGEISDFQEKTSLAFKTRHRPGALVDCLKIFQENQLNLTKLESRPIPDNPWEYVFYADVEAGGDSSAVAGAVQELSSHALFVKILGSYTKAVGDARQEKNQRKVL